MNGHNKHAYADLESFMRGGPTLSTFFVEGREDKKLLKGHHQSTIECWLGSFVIFQGIRTRLAKKPYSFEIIHGGGLLDPPPAPTH